MQKEKRSKADDFSQKRPLLLNEREPKIVGVNRLQVILPCPVPPLSCRIAQSTSSLKGFSELSHKEMVESLLSSESFPGLRQHAAALLPTTSENESLDLVFNDPLGLEVDLFHPHSLYDALPSHSTTSTHASFSSQNGEASRDDDTSSLPLEDMFLVNPQLYFDFVAEREKEAKREEEKRAQIVYSQKDIIPDITKQERIEQNFEVQSKQEEEKEKTEFEQVQKFKIGFQDEGRQIVEVCELLPQIFHDGELSLSIANLQVKASQLKQSGSHLFTFEDLSTGQTKKPTRLQSFTAIEKEADQELARFKEEASILALTKKSQDDQGPLALVGSYSYGQFVTMPIYNRFKTSTLEKLTSVGQRVLMVGPGVHKLEDIGLKELELKEDEEILQDKGDLQQNDYLSDDMGLAMLHGGPMVEQAPLQSEDEQGF